MALNFKIKIDADATAVDKAASSVYRLDAAIKNEASTLGQLQASMRELKKSGDTGSETFKKLSAGIADQRNKVAALKDKMVDAGGIPKASSNASALDGILKQLTGSTGGLGKSLAGMGTAGLVASVALGAIVIAATAAAGAVAYLTTKLFEFGVTASEAKGDVTRSLELLYGGEKAAEHTYKVLESLTGDIAISQGRVMELADTLIKAGQVNGDAMVKSIAAIGKAEAARAGAGKVIEGVITRSQQARMFSISRSELMQVGLSYRDLAKEISKGTGMAVGDAELRLRTGGVALKAGLNALTGVIDAKMSDLANKKFMTVTVQANRVREAFSRLFEGVNAGPFARVLNMIATQLSESSVSGAALRSLLKSAFDSMSNAAEAALPFVQTLFEGAILLALKLYNATYPVEKALKKLFSGVDQSTFEDKILLAVNSLGLLGDAMGEIMAYRPLWYALGVSIGLTALPFAVLAGAAFGVGYAFAFLIDKGSSAVGWLAELPGKAYAFAGDLINGIVNGITSGAGKVADAIKNMALGALKKFKEVFRISSPSKTMQLEAAFIPAGAAKGVNDNADEPVRAVSKMANNMVAAGSAAGRGGSAGGGAGGSSGAPSIVLNFGERSIVVSGNNAQEIAASLKDPLTAMMADVLEKVAAMSGALEVKGAA